MMRMEGRMRAKTKAIAPHHVFCQDVQGPAAEERPQNATPFTSPPRQVQRQKRRSFAALLPFPLRRFAAVCCNGKSNGKGEGDEVFVRAKRTKARLTSVKKTMLTSVVNLAFMDLHGLHGLLAAVSPFGVRGCVIWRPSMRWK